MLKNSKSIEFLQCTLLKYKICRVGFVISIGSKQFVIKFLYFSAGSVTVWKKDVKIILDVAGDIDFDAYINGVR